MIKRFMPAIPYSLRISGLLLTTWLPTAIMAEATKEDIGVFTPDQATQARETILNWLECVDCHDKELEMVAQLGPIAVPSLIASLRQGPSEAQRERMRRRLITFYSLLKQSEGGKPAYRPSMSESAYIEYHLQGYVNHYRIQAAIALGHSSGPQAKSALQAALSENYPASVSTVVRKSLQRMESLPAMSE